MILTGNEVDDQVPSEKARSGASNSFVGSYNSDRGVLEGGENRRNQIGLEHMIVSKESQRSRNIGHDMSNLTRLTGDDESWDSRLVD